MSLLTTTGRVAASLWWVRSSARCSSTLPKSLRNTNGLVCATHELTRLPSVHSCGVDTASTILDTQLLVHRYPGQFATMSGIPSSPTADEVLQYWYHGDADNVSEEHTEFIRALWFGKSDLTDEYIRSSYGNLVEIAMRGELVNHPDWCGSTQKLVAQIILLDQFTRNSFRNDKKMYAGDEVCINLTRKILATRSDRDLPFLQRVTVYLPLEHSEKLADQKECKDLFTELVDDYAPGGRLSAAPDASEKHSQAVSYVEFAVKHLDIVAKWGRFPHRNAILGRETTPDEAVFLTQKGSSF
eukprot:m.1031168 g.1031168  ORF g.1031168 m.1031168 type:complete len:299 (+) comp24121_c0_seq2:96-992(+)